MSTCCFRFGYNTAHSWTPRGSLTRNPYATTTNRFGPHAWAGTDCKSLRKGIPGGRITAWVLSRACALQWRQPVLVTRVGFMVLAPAVAALSAIALIRLRPQQKPAAPATNCHAKFLWSLHGTGSTLLPPK